MPKELKAAITCTGKAGLGELARDAPRGPGLALGPGVGVDQVVQTDGVRVGFLEGRERLVQKEGLHPGLELLHEPQDEARVSVKLGGVLVVGDVADEVAVGLDKGLGRALLFAAL
eukprot:992991-Rhodomonas_salina.1